MADSNVSYYEIPYENRLALVLTLAATSKPEQPYVFVLPTAELQKLVNEIFFASKIKCPVFAGSPTKRNAAQKAHAAGASVVVIESALADFTINDNATVLYLLPPRLPVTTAARAAVPATASAAAAQDDAGSYTDDESETEAQGAMLSFSRRTHSLHARTAATHVKTVYKVHMAARAAFLSVCDHLVACEVDPIPLVQKIADMCGLEAPLRWNPQ